MNKPIDIDYPRTLLLENTVRVLASIDDPAGIQEAALGLNRFIRARGAAPRGPLIQVVRVDQEGGRNPPTNELLRQASAPVDPEGDQYRFAASIEVSGCVLARYEGDMVNLPIVYSKFAVFSYENEVALAGTFYVVFLEQDGSAISADIFAVTGEGL